MSKRHPPRGHIEKRESHRRASGEGTIYYHKASGRYAAQITVGTKPDGKRDRRTVYGSTPEEVADKLHTLRQQSKDGTLPIPNRITVGQWAEQWLNEFSSLKDHRVNTREMYDNAIRYITDAHGGMRLVELTGQHLTDLYIKMRERVGLRQCEIVHNTAGLMLRAAVKKKYIPRDVTDDVAYAPRAVYDDEPRALKPEEFAAILSEAAAMQGTKGRWVAGFRLAVNAALGRGELLGVRWGDLDLEQHILTVRHQITRINGGVMKLGPLKTKARHRDVILGNDTVAALKQWRDVLRQETGFDVFPAAAYVFCWAHRGRYRIDEPTSPEALNAAFRKCCDRAGVENATFHTLRATCATWLAESGVPLKTTMRITGHSNPETLTKYYIRVTEASIRDAAKKIESITGNLAPNASALEPQSDSEKQLWQ